LDCKHAARLISQSQDARLFWRQRVGLRFHLLLCEACAQFSGQLRLLREAVRQAGRQIERDEGLKLSPQAYRRIAALMASRQRGIIEAGQHPDQDFSD
jgi:hypothetical protein